MRSDCRSVWRWWLAGLVVAIWGTSYAIAKWALASFPPLLMAALRFSCAALPCLWVRPPLQTPWSRLALFGLLIGPGEFALIFYALHKGLPAGLAGVLIQAQVPLTIAMAAIWRRERLRPLQFIALIVASSGLSMIGYEATMGAQAAVSPTPILLCVAAAFCWAIANITGSGGGATSTIEFISRSSLWATGSLYVLSLVVEGPTDIRHALVHAHTSAWFAILWQGIGNTLIGYGIWNALLTRHPASTIAPVALLIPIVGLLASHATLLEPLPTWEVLATALVLTGVALNSFPAER